MYAKCSALLLDKVKLQKWFLSERGEGRVKGPQCSPGTLLSSQSQCGERQCPSVFAQFSSQGTGHSTCAPTGKRTSCRPEGPAAAERGPETLGQHVAYPRCPRRSHPHPGGAGVREGWKPGERAAEADSHRPFPSNARPAPSRSARRAGARKRGRAAVAMAARPPRPTPAAPAGCAGSGPRVGGGEESPPRLRPLRARVTG